jgi:HK97 family phage portal protein
MGLFDRFKKAKNQVNNTTTNTVIIERILGDYHKRYPVTTNPVIISIINNISKTFSNLGLDLYQTSKNGRFIVYDNTASRLLSNPNTEETATPFLHGCAKDYLSYGNCYLWNKGNVLLKRLDPNYVEIQKNKEAPYNLVYKYQGETIPNNQILHIFDPTYYDGVKGHSVIEQNSNLIQLHNDLLLYISVYFNNSIGSKFAIEFDKEVIKDLSTESLKLEFTKYIEENIMNKLDSGKPLIGWPGMKFNKIDQTKNSEAELATLIERIEKQIAQLFGYPIHKITGDYGNNLQSQQVIYLQDCLLQITEIFSESFNKLIPSSAYSLYQKFMFDYSNLLMVDPVAKTTMIKSQLESDIISTNEARFKLDYMKYDPTTQDAGDLIFKAVNKVPLTNDNIDKYFANAQKSAILTPSKDDKKYE